MADGNVDLVNYFAQRHISPGMTVLDIGGANLSTLPFCANGADLTILDIRDVRHPGVSSIKISFYDWIPDQVFDVIWCSHLLEHIANVGSFLNKVAFAATDDTIFAIIVPPAKDNLVGGHVNLFTPANLCYNIILSGQNLSNATVIVHKYNIAIFWRRFDWPMPILNYDKGDIETLAILFPRKVYQGINGIQGWDRIRADGFDELLNHDVLSDKNR